MMKHLLTLSLAAAAIAFTQPAHSAIVDARFSGTVSSQTGTALSLGSPVSGEFIYNIGSNVFSLFTIGGQSAAPGYASSADFTPDMLSALYQAQLSPVLGGSLNSTFLLDLEALFGSPWSAANPIALLSSGQLATKLDTSASTFSFYIADPAGTTVQSLTATLGNLSITAVPEPGSLLLFAAGGVLLGVNRFGSSRMRRQSWRKQCGWELKTWAS